MIFLFEILWEVLFSFAMVMMVLILHASRATRSQRNSCGLGLMRPYVLCRIYVANSLAII